MELSVVPGRNHEAGPLSVLLTEEHVSADSAAALAVVFVVFVAVLAGVVVAVEALSQTFDYWQSFVSNEKVDLSQSLNHGIEHQKPPMEWLLSRPSGTIPSVLLVHSSVWQTERKRLNSKQIVSRARSFFVPS